MLKPWSGLAAMMLLLSMALFVTAIVSSHWVENQSVGRQSYLGPFEACVRDYKEGIDECRRVDDTCGAGLSQPTDISGLIGCNHVRATRAFLIIGLVWASMAFLMAWIGYHAWDDIMYRGLVIMLSLFSFASGLIAWAIFLGGVKDMGSEWNYGWGTGIALGAWLLPLGAMIACMVPSPLRDLKTGEVIARDTIRGRRGSYADIFTRDFWTRGEGLGAQPSSAGAAAGGAGLGYEAGRTPAGTGYRETGYSKEEPRYRYGESAESREREFREREREREPRTGGMLSSVFGGRKEEPLTERELAARREAERTGGYYGAEPRPLTESTTQPAGPSREASAAETTHV